MPVKRGDTGIAKLYRGSVEILKRYRGDQLVYSSGPPPLTINNPRIITFSSSSVITSGSGATFAMPGYLTQAAALAAGNAAAPGYRAQYTPPPWPWTHVISTVSTVIQHNIHGEVRWSYFVIIFYQRYTYSYTYGARWDAPTPPVVYHQYRLEYRTTSSGSVTTAILSASTTSYSFGSFRRQFRVRAENTISGVSGPWTAWIT